MALVYGAQSAPRRWPSALASERPEHHSPRREEYVTQSSRDANSSTHLIPSLRVGLGHYPCGMADPSDYELRAWRDIQRFKGRRLSRVMGNASEQAANGAAQLGKRATKYLENRPRAQSAVSHGQEVVAKGAHAVGAGARKAVDTLPDGMTGWSGAALESMQRTVGRVSRAGLSPKRVVASHQKRGHDVASLSDLRRLDLEQIDAVRGRGASWYYPAAAALSGAGAGLVISGGELVVTVSAGAAAAPSGARSPALSLPTPRPCSDSRPAPSAMSRCSTATIPKSPPRSSS